MTIRFRSLCRALGYSPDMIEQHIVRGYFVPKAGATQGRARVWSQADAFALAMFETLFQIGVPASEASQLSYLIAPGIPNRLLVVWPVPGRSSQAWTHEIVDEREFDYPAWRKAKAVSWAAPIGIDHVAKQAVTAFEAAAEIEESVAAERPKKLTKKAALKRQRGRRR